MQFATLVVFPGLMAYAALSDLLTMTISNRISLALFVLFLPLAVAAGLPAQLIAVHYLVGFGMLTLGFALFAFGWIGGGDAKLAAATAIWMGLDNIEAYGIYSALFGGALTLLILAARHLPLPIFLAKLEWADRLHDRESGVPYGVALAAGGLAIYPQTLLWHAAASLA